MFGVLSDSLPTCDILLMDAALTCISCFCYLPHTYIEIIPQPTYAPVVKVASCVCGIIKERVSEGSCQSYSINLVTTHVPETCIDVVYSSEGVQLYSSLTITISNRV